jgi:hypothetical protein
MSSSANQATSSNQNPTENTQQSNVQPDVKTQPKEQTQTSQNEGCASKNYFRYFLYVLGASSVAVGSFLLFKRFSRR